MSQNYGLELQQIMSGINHLKGLVAKLGTASTAVPTVDFLCDMFDRPDSSVLNGYWADATGNWALRSNIAIYQGTEASLGTAGLTSGACSLSVSAFGAQSYVLNSTSANGSYTTLAAINSYRANLYGAKLSSADFRVKIGFNLIPPVSTSVSTTSTAGNQTTNTTANSALAFSANVGIAVGSRTAGRTLGVAFQGAQVPSVTLPGGSGSAVGGTPAEGYPGPSSSISLPGGTLAAGSAAASQFGMLTTNFTGAPVTMTSTVRSDITTFTATTIPAFNSTPYQYMQGSMSATTGVAVSATLAPVVGANTLEMLMQGNVYEVYLNGALWFTATRAMMTDRAQPGILNYAANMLGYMDLNNRALWGITSFKAWPMGQGEPIDQSGHGTYATGYSDKYHTAGVYNPLA